MKKFNLLLLALILFPIAEMLAQATTFTKGGIIYYPPGYYDTQAQKDYGMDGSPFLDEEWQEGVLTNEEGVVIKGLTYRYNVYGNQMQFKKDDEVFSIGAPQKVIKLVIQGREFIYDKFYNYKNVETDFFEVAYNGECKLLIRREAAIKPAKYYTTHNVGNQKDKIIINKVFYSKKGEEPAKVLRLTKRAVLNVFEDKRVEMEKYMKDNDLKAKNYLDLVKMFNYYNSLK